jgi:rare lipoprotein A
MRALLLLRQSQTMADKGEPSSVTRGALAIAVLCALGACAPTTPPTSSPPAPAVRPAVFTQVGVASWYGSFHAGRKTASGERFDPNAMTAAHRTLPLGSIVRVTNVENGLTTMVRINDRGPYYASRIIDLSRAAADALGFRASGIALVRIERLASDQ